MRRRDAAAILLLVALVALAFGDVLFLGRAFYFRDITRYYYPSKKLLSAIVRSGEFPSWNPFWAAGQPLAANPDYATFYPVQWLTFVPGFDFWFRLHIVLHLAIAAAGTYFLLRARALRTESAIFGAIVFSLSGLMLSQINLLPILYCLTWLPWIALAVERRWFAAAALFLALSMLGGDPVTIAEVCLLFAGFAVVRKIPWTRIAAIGLAAAAVAAVQLLPAVDLVRDTPRSHPFPFSLVSQWSTPPVRLLDLLIPQFSGPASGHFRLYWGTASYGWLDPFFVGIYFGLIPISLAVAGLTLRLPGWRAITFTFAAATFLALGSHTPLLRVLYALRLFSSFRYPEKFLILGLVPLMFFSAVAFDRAIGGDGRILRRALILASIPAAICAILIGLSLHPSYSSHFVAFWNVGIHPGAALMARVSRTVFLLALIRSTASIAVLWYAIHKSPRTWAPIAIVVTLLDLGYQRLSIAETVPGDFFRVPPRALQQIRPGVRVFHQADWYSATPVARRYLDLPQMYWMLRNGLYPMFGATWGVPVAMNRDIDATFIGPATDFNVAIAELRSRNVPRWFEPLMAMSATGYRALYLPFEEQAERFRNDPEEIEPNIFVSVPTNPIFYFADRIVNCKSRDQFIDLVARGAATPRVAFADLVPAPLADGRIVSIRQRSNAAEIDIESAGNALLVCSITRHKYWRAAIDGREARLIPVNLQYQGLLVPAGRHTVRIAYRNPLLIVGASISIVALITLVALMLRKGHDVREEILEPPLELQARVD